MIYLFIDNHHPIDRKFTIDFTRCFIHYFNHFFFFSKTKLSFQFNGNGNVKHKWYNILINRAKPSYKYHIYINKSRNVDLYRVKRIRSANRMYISSFECKRFKSL